MTHAQWMWMYHAHLIEEKRSMDKQTAWFKLGIRSGMEAMVSVLGLRFRKDKAGDAKDDAKDKLDPSAPKTPHSDEVDKMLGDMKSFTPLSLLIAPPEALKAAMDHAEREGKAEDALANPHLESLSEAIANRDFDGDMSPLGDLIDRIEGRLPPLPKDPAIAAAERKRINASLGIVDFVPDENVPTIDIMAKPKKAIPMKVWPVNKP